jgi:hypothetical protein
MYCMYCRWKIVENADSDTMPTRDREDERKERDAHLRSSSSAREPNRSAEAEATSPRSLFRPDCLVSSKEVSRRELP